MTRRPHFDEAPRVPANGCPDVRAAQQIVRAVGLETVATDSKEVFLRKVVMLGADADADRHAAQFPEIEARACCTRRARSRPHGWAA